MITAYSGEFTISPLTLELTMNFCSHKCFYCFANLNKPGRTLDFPALVNQIKNHKNQKNLTARLLQDKYPVLISNKTDPFAKSNFRQTLAVAEILREYKIPLMIQTKGGEGIEEFLKLINPSVFYVSMAFFDDNKRKLIEPAAPSIGERFFLMEKLLTEGHTVSVGVNPVVEEWLPFKDAEGLGVELKRLGIKGVWMENIHLNQKQISCMSAKELKAIGAVANVATRRKNRTDEAYLRFVEELFLNLGFDVFSMNQPRPSAYFDSYHKAYSGKTIKTHQDFINHLCKGPDKEVLFEEYYEFMKADFYENSFSDCDGYVYTIARNIHKTLKQRIKTLKDVLKTYWNYPNIAKSLAGNKLFRVCREKAGRNEFDMTDEEGNFIYWFSKNPSNSWVYYMKGGEE